MTKIGERDRIHPHYPHTAHGEFRIRSVKTYRTFLKPTQSTHRFRSNLFRILCIIKHHLRSPRSACIYLHTVRLDYLIIFLVYGWLVTLLGVGGPTVKDLVQLQACLGAAGFIFSTQSPGDGQLHLLSLFFWIPYHSEHRW